MSYVYETTFEVEDHLETVIASMEVRVEYTYEPGKAAPICRIEGRQMEPDDGPEVEITGIEVEHTRKVEEGMWETYWRPANKMEREALDTWLECTVYDQLIETVGPDAYANEQW